MHGPGEFRVAVLLAAVGLGFASLGEAQTEPKANDAFTPFLGSLSQAVSVEAPAFRGLEPRLALVYSSERRNGFAGVGWGLTGFSTVVRTKGGRGIPRFDGTDVFLLDGQELVPCPAPNPSPSCEAGGTHTTKNESHLKLSFDRDRNEWTVWGRDGTRTLLTAVYETDAGTLRWGQTSTVDTHNNSVTYAWSCAEGDCYPDSVAYGRYSVKLYREARPDVVTFAIGQATSLGQTRYRLRSVLVARAGSPIRAYRLTYGESPVTGRSRLTAVQQYGRDVVIDAEGAISGGTSLPPRRFTYQDDPAAGSFQPWPAGQ